MPTFTRQQMEDTLARGGTILWRPKTGMRARLIHRVEQIPTEAELAEFDPGRTGAALRALRAQKQALEAQITKLEGANRFADPLDAAATPGTTTEPEPTGPQPTGEPTPQPTPTPRGPALPGAAPQADETAAGESTEAQAGGEDESEGESEGPGTFGRRRRR